MVVCWTMDWPNASVTVDILIQHTDVKVMDADLSTLYVSKRH